MYIILENTRTMLQQQKMLKICKCIHIKFYALACKGASHQILIILIK